MTPRQESLQIDSGEKLVTVSGLSERTHAVAAFLAASGSHAVKR
jgi:hypothetical protein